jgi:hypothetical protein
MQSVMVAEVVDDCIEMIECRDESVQIRTLQDAELDLGADSLIR